MTEDRFEIIFEHMEKEAKEQIGLQTYVMEDTLEQNAEIKKLIEIITDVTPTDEPLLYSSS